MLTKRAAWRRPGALKPLGFGTTTTALKRGLADPSDVAEAVDLMKP
jgi:hypothetical protein